MSVYHANCNKPCEDQKNKDPTSNQSKLTSKPFCDCNGCSCKDCPDILKMYSITVTEKSCHFGPKVTNECKVSKSEPGQPEETVNEIKNLLQTVNRDCGCEVVARAMASNIHTNMCLMQSNNEANPEKCADKEAENGTEQ